MKNFQKFNFHFNFNFLFNLTGFKNLNFLNLILFKLTLIFKDFYYSFLFITNFPISKIFTRSKFLTTIFIFLDFSHFKIFKEI